MKKIIFLFIFIPSIVFSQWVQQNAGTTASLYSIFIADANTGYVTGDSLIFLKTTNGGMNWVRKNTGFPGTNIYGTYFISAQIGWLYGYPGIIMKTTNGGENWLQQQSAILYDVDDLFFISETIGWAISWSEIAKTTNGGTNWFIADSNSAGDFIHFISTDTGFASGFWGEILKTVNGGINWYMVAPPDIPNHHMHSSSFPSHTAGWVAGEGWMLRTINGGDNWSLTQQWANSVFFVTVSTGWYVGYDDNQDPAIYRTTNSGTNWVLQYSNIEYDFYKTFFVNVNTGWVVGWRGLILKTTNGGASIGIKPISSEIPNRFSLSQNYPNPFNPTTKIKFSIPLSRGVSEGRGVLVKLSVYDILGSETAVLVNEQLSPGSYEITWDASACPSGVYFYRLVVSPALSGINSAEPLTGGNASSPLSITKKMVLVK